MSRKQVAAVVRLLYYREGMDLELPDYVVLRALNAVIDTVLTRLERGEAAYWRHVGVFSVIDCSSRVRNVPLSKADGYGRSARLFPAYRRIRYRRSVYMNEIR